LFTRLSAQGVDGIDFELRRLYLDLIVHAVYRIEPLIRGGLAAGAERNEHAVGDIALGQPRLMGLAAVDRDFDLGGMHLLVDMDVDSAGHDSHCALDLLGKTISGDRIAGHDLHINGRGDAEIQDLIRHVGGLKEKDFVREALPESTPQHALDLHRGTVAFLIEGDQDFAVGRADGCIIAPCQGERRRRQADVIRNPGDLAWLERLAYGGLDRAENPLGFLDARAFRGAHMEAKLARIDVREEVGSNHEDQAQRGKHQQGIDAAHARAMVQAPAEHSAVPGPHFFEPRIEFVMRVPDETFGVGQPFLASRVNIHFRAQHVMHHCGDQRTREEIRHQHGEGHRECERCEEKFRRTCQQQHRNEDNADGEGRDERGQRDLLSAIENGACEHFRHSHIAVDVFNLHCGVVDQDADGQRHAPERHHIDGVARGPQDDARGENRQRYGSADDDRAAPAAEEQQDHNGGEPRGDGSFLHHSVDGLEHENTLIEKRAHVER
jgi:hypothetical protein